MSQWPVLVFDIETIPDVSGLRVLRGGDTGLSDDEVLAQALSARAAEGRSDFLPHHLQRVVTISCVYRGADGLRVHSFVDRSGRSGPSEEGRIVQQFFSSIEKRVPQLVSWNGGGFDLPVLHYRGLMHNVVASKYWDFGEDDREFKFNNYISRYHHRHLDLMDLLALYQPRANAPLDAMAKLCGLPGKLGMDGSAVHAAWREGRIDDIRRYCETDVMNTYLLYCRYQLMRGGLNSTEHAQEVAMVRGELAAQDEPHWREYLAAWPA
ncbi:MAG TPA: 3'-5' exonuclease [Burkholderiaceae bacterium]|nr:3'-5' exonuclease [Burkholderiaceae bacterium]